MAKTSNWFRRMFARRTEPEQTRAITEFAIIDGQQVFGSELASTAYRGGMTIPGAWRAAVLLSDLLGLVPWHAFRERAGKPIERLFPTPLLLEQPNPPDTRMTTFSSWGLDLIWDGNAIGVIAARNAFGWPTAAIAVPASWVGVRRVDDWRTSPLPVGTIEYKIGSLSLGADEVIHIKGPCAPGALRGMGVLEAHMSTLELADEQNRQARSITQHGVPTGVLKSDNPDLTKTEATDLKTGWLASQRDRTIAVLNATTSFQPLAWNPKDSQMIEARTFTLTELELIFGLPVGWLGGMNSARQYSNIEQDAVNLLKFSLGGHLARFEQTLSLHFPRGTTAKANLDVVLRPDTLTRYQAHAIALGGAPFMEVDEVRELEDRPPMPEPPEPPPPPPTDDEPPTDPTQEEETDGEDEQAA